MPQRKPFTALRKGNPFARIGVDPYGHYEYEIPYTVPPTRPRSPPQSDAERDREVDAIARWFAREVRLEDMRRRQAGVGYARTEHHAVKPPPAAKAEKKPKAAPAPKRMPPAAPRPPPRSRGSTAIIDMGQDDFDFDFDFDDEPVIKKRSRSAPAPPSRRGRK